MGIIPAAIKGGKHRRQHNGRSHDQDIICHAEGFFVVEDEVGHENLDGDAEACKGQQGEIQHLMPADDRGAEAIQDAAPIAAGRRRGDFGLPDEPEADNADEDDHHTDDGKNGDPACGLFQIEHKAAEHHQNGHHGHHGIDALRSATVGIIGAIGEPGIKAGIIGGGAEEGHDAIHDDGEIDADGGDRHARRDHGADDIHPDEGKAENGNTPQQVPHADENFSPADPVAEGADEDGGESGHHCRSGDHKADLGGGGVEHLIDEHIEVHVFHHPGHLPHQREHRKGQPEPAAELCFLHRNISCLSR